MRVAVVTPRFPPDPGGVEQYAAWVARTLRDRGHDVTVVTTGARAGRSTHDGIPVVRLGTWFTLSNTPVNPLWAVQLRRLLRGVDVVNAHAPVPGLADLAAYVSPAPVVLTYHSGSLAKGSRVDPLLRGYERTVLPRVFRRSKALVAVSPVSLAHGTGRATLIPPGVDTRVFHPGTVQSSGGPRECRVLYVGRVEQSSRWKGLQVLLDALPRLRELVPQVRLEIVGDGDDLTTLQKQAADLGVADVVDWAGRVDHADLPARYRRAGVTVLPSLTESESFGMALAEALACGCPVVGSDVGGIPFVVRDGVDGRLVPPGDPAALAEALAGVLTDPPQVEPGRWGWDQRVEATVRVIEEAA